MAELVVVMAFMLVVEWLSFHASPQKYAIELLKWIRGRVLNWKHLYKHIRDVQEQLYLTSHVAIWFFMFLECLSCHVTEVATDVFFCVVNLWHIVKHYVKCKVMVTLVDLFFVDLNGDGSKCELEIGCKKKVQV